MNVEVESYIRQNVEWAKVPNSVKQLLGDSHKEYEKCIITFSVQNQLRYDGNLIRYVKINEKKYYEELIDYGRTNLMLFPYHLSAEVIRNFKITTPFRYYSRMMENLMLQEKSYDSLPNFSAADCLRLLGIGRNQYIDLMNQSRSTKKFGAFFRNRSFKELLPSRPVSTITILPWWTIQLASSAEEEVKHLDKYEALLISQTIDTGPCPAGHLSYDTVLSLYLKGHIYFDVPISDNDHVVVPPLEGFVMNRVLGDFLEKLMYKIFVSIDENTTVSELASVLEVDSKSVRDAVSVYCRLGFAKKKNCEMDSNDLHPSWYNHLDQTLKRQDIRYSTSISSDEDDSLLRELNQALESDEFINESSDEVALEIDTSEKGNLLSTLSTSKKIAFLFDSTLTAYLMMGNLSPGLKNHAVTMFEVGKLSDESLDSFVLELEKVSKVEGEGEAARYFSHALTLMDTINFLRQNPSFKDDEENMSLGLDLIRCESLQSLESSTIQRLLNKNYSLLVSMAPLSNIKSFGTSLPPHLGPLIPELSSVWFKLYLYQLIGYGPPSVLLVKGCRLRKLPKILRSCSKLLITTWGHEPTEIPCTGSVTMLLDALQHSSVLVQAYSYPPEIETETRFVPFPFDKDVEEEVDVINSIKRNIDVENFCGYVTLIKLNSSCVKVNDAPDEKGLSLLEEEINNIDDSFAAGEESKSARRNVNNTEQAKDDWTILDLHFGLPLFDEALNKSICQKIIDNKLWKNKSQNHSKDSNVQTYQNFIEFINQYKPSKGPMSEVPYPSNNLIFQNGELSELKIV